MPKYIYTWNRFSEGANLLKQEMGIRKIKQENSRFVGGPNKTVINWGASELPPEVLRSRVINDPQLVAICSNKLHFFRRMHQHDPDIIPPWTESFDTAIEWITNHNHVVCARTVLQGHSAEGLVVMERNNPQSFVRARLYTQYVKKKEEYRIHVANGGVIDVQRKTLKREKAESGEEINWKVRNHANGFIYQRNNITPRECVLDAARRAMRAIGLTFGAVDVIYNSQQDKAFVLEINTAPGITGTTVTNYANALNRL